MKPQFIIFLLVDVISFVVCTRLPPPEDPCLTPVTYIPNIFSIEQQQQQWLLEEVFQKRILDNFSEKQLARMEQKEGRITYPFVDENFSRLLWNKLTLNGSQTSFLSLETRPKWEPIDFGLEFVPVIYRHPGGKFSPHHGSETIRDHRYGDMGISYEFANLAKIVLYLGEFIGGGFMLDNSRNTQGDYGCGNETLQNTFLFHPQAGSGILLDLFYIHEALPVRKSSLKNDNSNHNNNNNNFTKYGLGVRIIYRKKKEYKHDFEDTVLVL